MKTLFLALAIVGLAGVAHAGSGCAGMYQSQSAEAPPPPPETAPST